MGNLLPQDLLADKSMMDGFIHELLYCKIANASGSSFRCHPICHFSDGILLVSNHHTSRSCQIKIAAVPETGIKLGCQDSCAYGDPYPKPKQGEFVTVWSSGKWVKEGPWEPKVIELLESLILRVEEVRFKKKAEKQKEKERMEEERMKREDEILKAWSGT